MEPIVMPAIEPSATHPRPIISELREPQIRRLKRVAPELVGAEQVLGARACVAVEQVLLVVGIGGDKRREYCDKYLSPTTIEPGDGESVLFELVPGLAEGVLFS